MGVIVGCSPDNGGPASERAALRQASADQEKGWQQIFNGTDLSSFRIFGNPDAPLDRWGIEDGFLCLQARPEGSNSKVDLIITQDPIGDFEFSFEWRMSAGGNGGIFYKVKDGNDYEKPWHTGLEMQLLDNAGHKEGKIETHRSGDLYDLIASSADTTKAAGEWNHSRILVRGNHVEQWMNGHMAVSFEIGSDDWNSLVAKSKYAEWPEYAKIQYGHIILQDHGDKIWFRNLRLREL